MNGIAYCWPRSDEAAYDRGWQLQLVVGFPRSFAFGWTSDIHRSEWSVTLFLGPISLAVWRPR